MTVLPEAHRVTSRFNSPPLLALEKSKYGLRMILLLYSNGVATLTWLTKHIPTSPNTVLRCLRVLQSLGFISDFAEPDGRRRRLYGLTSHGVGLATRPPAEWLAEEAGLRKP